MNHETTLSAGVFLLAAAVLFAEFAFFARDLDAASRKAPETVVKPNQELT